MKTFLTGVVIGILAGLVACTAPTPAAAPAPTRAASPQASIPPTRPPTAAPPTEAPPTDTALPVPTNTRRPAITLTASRTPAPSATAVPSDTAAPTVTPARVFITYQDFEILPAVTTIKAGTPVTFLIRAGLLIFHQPYNFTTPNVFEAPANLGDGAAYNFTFTEPGTVTLLCGYHPDMRATLIVEP